MGTKVTLDMRDRQRLEVVASLDAGRITAEQAAELLGRCVRQLRRILSRYRKEHTSGIPHKNRGRKPHNALPDAVRARGGPAAGGA
jgi:hypothetical protein